MSTAKSVLTIAAAVVVLPLAMRARESASARASSLPGMSVTREDPQATVADVRAYLEGMRRVDEGLRLAGLPERPASAAR